MLIASIFDLTGTNSTIPNKIIRKPTRMLFLGQRNQFGNSKNYRNGYLNSEVNLLLFFSLNENTKKIILHMVKLNPLKSVGLLCYSKNNILLSFTRGIGLKSTSFKEYNFYF